MSRNKIIDVDAEFIFHGTIQVKAKNNTDAYNKISNGFCAQIVIGDRVDDDIIDWDIKIKPIEQKFKAK